MTNRNHSKRKPHAQARATAVITVAHAPREERRGLSRERRTGRNTDAKVLRERVLGLLDQGHAIGLADRLHRNEVDSLRQHLGCWSRRRLDSAFKAYQQTCEQGVTQDAIGQPHRSNGAEVAKHLRAILKETKRV